MILIEPVCDLAGTQGHAALQHDSGVPPVWQDGAPGRRPGDLRGVPLHPAGPRRHLCHSCFSLLFEKSLLGVISRSF